MESDGASTAAASPATTPRDINSGLTLARPRIIIIGGGPCGIGAAVRLQELGYSNWTLCEKSNTWGGLSSSIRDNEGFLWDIGGHVVFSHYKYFDDVCSKLGPKKVNTMKRKCVLFMEKGDCVCLQGLLQSYWENLRRDKKCTMADISDSTKVASERTIKITANDEGSRPLRSNAADKAQAFSSSVENPPPNFAEWGYRILGKGIVDVFLRPYNEKLWSWPLESMGSGWLGERVAVPDFNKVLGKFVTGLADENWGPNSEFKYPAEGGTGAIWKCVGSHLDPEKCHLGVSIDVVDGTTGTIYYSNGSYENYDILINTMPLTELVSNHLKVEPLASENLKNLASKLKFSHVVVVGIGIRGQRPEVLNKFSWSYFPQSDAPMFRVTALSNYSQAMCPGEDYYSLLCEVGFSDWKKRAASVEEVADEVEVALRRYKLITEDAEIVSKFSQDFHYGYPTPSVDRDEILAEMQSVLMSYGILSRGRFGGWKYEAGNMDHSMMQGVEAADFILSRISGLHLPFRAEDTYFNVGKINDPANRSEVPLTNLRVFEQARKQWSTGKLEKEAEASELLKHVEKAPIASNAFST
eukprot:Gregarina_sp_Poly_1__4540@NODE_2438_length_2135_cov_971_492263_g1498_i2_p1_GENE_NODE_2438_length_2135_cov_971_492263_g1498_i2NODE_2438_length_2135_cov_971_492263_g1498_i2_p1_ORF_typecomplete_len583_score84_17Amino_oxidase/PF01593_24/3_6e21NAD_binding_8/PF13450_6/9_6e11Pyr_redox_3/PF13738_6/0_00011Pyr_redox_3/PF13738_6/7_2e03Thi4/PF01946_17/8_3e05Thi4/PF01946_17/6e03DAO/PF01266_24/0_00013Pyr_redox_2/PF07992_14/0_00037Pyr_redox_2/PF07992_14/7_1e03FAD_binding_2/PF00890_24/0_00023FAD_oxidored/PF1283